MPKEEEIINDSIMKDPEVCKMLAKQHILELIVILLKSDVRVENKYYLELAEAIHKL